MLAAAAVLDLIHGGYYRARPGAILFYCGPENAPKGWNAGFREGSPDLPRGAVGTAEALGWDERGDTVTVRLRVTDWRAFVLDQESAPRGRTEEQAWLQAEFERLRNHALGRALHSGRERG